MPTCMRRQTFDNFEMAGAAAFRVVECQAGGWEGSWQEAEMRPLRLPCRVDCARLTAPTLSPTIAFTPLPLCLESHRPNEHITTCLANDAEVTPASSALTDGHNRQHLSCLSGEQVRATQIGHQGACSFSPVSSLPDAIWSETSKKRTLPASQFPDAKRPKLGKTVQLGDQDIHHWVLKNTPELGTTKPPCLERDAHTAARSTRPTSNLPEIDELFIHQEGADLHCGLKDVSQSAQDVIFLDAPSPSLEDRIDWSNSSPRTSSCATKTSLSSPADRAERQEVDGFRQDQDGPSEEVCFGMVSQTTRSIPAVPADRGNS